MLNVYLRDKSVLTKQVSCEDRAVWSWVSLNKAALYSWGRAHQENTYFSFREESIALPNSVPEQRSQPVAALERDSLEGILGLPF